MPERNLHLEPKHLAVVREILKTHVPDHAVWAFGSRARGTAKPHSDLDLVVMTESPLDISLSAALTEAFQESDLPWKVDIVDWATTDTSFRSIIERDKIVVQPT